MDQKKQKKTGRPKKMNSTVLGRVNFIQKNYPQKVIYSYLPKITLQPFQWS